MSVGVRTTEAIVAAMLSGVALVLGVLPWIRHQYRSYGQLRGWSAVVAAGVVVYACGVVAFTLFPLPTVTADFCVTRTPDRMYQLRPFAWVAEVMDSAATWSGRLTGSMFVQVALNVALFVPLGFLLRYRWRRRLPAAAAIGLGLSLLIETVQGTAVFGLYPCPYRFADVDDLITNTAGAVVGWLVAGPVGRLLPPAVAEPVEDLDPPGLLRRGCALGADMLSIALWTLGVTVIVSLAAHGAGLESLQGWLTDGRAGAACLVAVVLVSVVAVPLLRPDRATPGQATFALAVIDERTGDPAPAWSVLRRALVWWIPATVLLLLGYWWVPPAVAGGLGLLARVRADRRSLLGLAGGDRTVTEPSLRTRRVTRSP